MKSLLAIVVTTVLGGVVAGCTTDTLREDGDENVATTQEALTTQAVTWTDVVNCTVSGSSIQKTGGETWAEDAHAISAQTVAGGRASVQFRVAETSAFRWLGFSPSTTWAGAAGMDFSWRLQKGSGEVYENGQWRHTGPIVGGDILKIEISDGVARYYRNGDLVYTSTKTPKYPLTVQASLISLNGTFKDVLLGTSSSVQYGYVPPAQQVYSGNTLLTVPAGYVHQTAWSAGGGPDIQGVYTHPVNGWDPMVWRWADTMRTSSIQRVTGPGGLPAYRFEVLPGDGASPGTNGGNPRAELFSTGPEEKKRRRPAPATAVLRDGDEYWATFAIYFPANFPTNHRWATLFQRKYQDGLAYPGWFTVNVHQNTVDVTVPGTTPDLFVPVTTLDKVAGRWVQFVAHEKLSSTNGFAELYVDGVKTVVKSSGQTVPAGDVNFHFQYGYYRSNLDRNGGTVAGAALYYTPMLIKRGATSGTVPALP